MRITRLEILETKIPFRFTFRHSLAARSEGHGILVRVTDDGGNVGYGECVPRSYVTGETPDSVKQAIHGSLALPWLGLELASFEDAVAHIETGLVGLPRDQHAAHCALELAILDAAGRAFGRSAGSVFGPRVTDEIAYSGVVSADGAETSLKIIELIRDFGFGQVKVKVGADDAEDEALLRHARDILGPDCRLRIDANCAWTWEQALRRIEDFTDLGIEAVEQPLAGDDIEGLVQLTARSPIPVIVDESLASLDDARTLIERRACHHFNIRISKCGGIVNSRRLRDAAHDAGLGCQLGAQVGETVLLSAAGNLFASRTEGLLFAEGSFGTILLATDIGKQDLTLRPRACARALDGPGLGVDVDTEKLAPMVVSTLEMRER